LPDLGNGRGSGLIRESCFEYLVSINTFLQLTPLYARAQR
jgi:hypothetical protein